MFGRVVKFQPLPKAVGFWRRKRFIQRGGRMGIEIVYDQANLLGFGEIAIDQSSHLVGEVLFRAPLRHLYMPPAFPWGEEYEEIAGTVALILIIIPGRLARARRQRHLNFPHQLVGARVKADHRVASIIGLGIEIQHVFHPPDKFGIHGRNTPLVFEPGVDGVFLSTRPTVSSEMDSTSPTSTNRAANRWRVQRSCPWGAALQANAIKKASCRPSSFGVLPGRLRSCTAPSSPSSPNRLRSRSTVPTSTWPAVAMAVSLAPVSACNKICTRQSLRAEILPRFKKSSSRSRSSLGWCYPGNALLRTCCKKALLIQY